MAACAAAKFFPSEPQLKAWRRAGLIPRPLEQHGRGRTRGSTTTYPPGTAAHLVALGELHKRERQLGPLAFLLWWHGFPVATATVCQALHQVIDEAEKALSLLVADAELTEQGWTAVERLEQDPRIPAALKRARKRAGKGHMSTVGRLLILGAGGVFPGWGETTLDDQPASALMSSAIGIGVLNGLLSASGTRERIPEDVEAALGALSASVNPGMLRSTLAEATDADLELARAELRAFASLIADVLYLSEKTPDLLAAVRQRDDHRIDPLSLIGLHAFGTIVQQLVPKWRELRAADAMLLFLAGLSLCRKPAIRRGLRDITRNGDEHHATRMEAERFFEAMSVNETEPPP